MRIDSASATELWKRRVETHHAQSLRAQAESGLEEREDFWSPFASFFKADPRRSDDPVMIRLLQEVNPSLTILDVGGGAGRYALPLALRCRQVTVVEPSSSMVEALRQGMSKARIKNIQIVQKTWEEAEVEPADLLLCAHVLYGVPNLAAFVTKLQAHARRKVLVLIFSDAPRVTYRPYGSEYTERPGSTFRDSRSWYMLCGRWGYSPISR